MTDRVAPAPSAELLATLTKESRRRIFRAKPWVFTVDDDDPPESPSAVAATPAAIVACVRRTAHPRRQSAGCARSGGMTLLEALQLWQRQ